MLPNFLIIGAQKAATSWLAKCIGEHPDIFMAKEKEVRFFNVFFDKGLSWYEPYFEEWSGETFVGEATPGYISNMDAARRIRSTLGGKIKLIASLRHPVDRAYSSFWHFVRRGRIPPETDFKSCFFSAGDKYGIRSRGNYLPQIRRYRELFPKENLLVFIYEEIKKDRPRAIKQCFSFLGADADFKPKSLDRVVNPGINLQFNQKVTAIKQWLYGRLKIFPTRLQDVVINGGSRALGRLTRGSLSNHAQYQALDPALRNELLQYYFPEIKQLEAFLHRDLSIWYGR